jgi:predicted Zn-dependent protease
VSPSAWPRFACVCLLALSAAGVAAPVLPPSKKDIDDWVRQLGARDFASRERAQRRLWESGERAEEALNKATSADDAEVRRRASQILSKFKWGIYPNTPKKVVALIEQYQAADRANKLILIGKLFDEGTAGCSTLLKIATAEDDTDLKGQMYQTIAREAARAVPHLFAGKDYATLEALLELAVNGETETAVFHYVAYHLLRGKLDERIAHYKKRAAEEREPNKQRVILFYLYRAKGDVAGALEAAEKANRDDLVAGLLEEQGRWKELARRADPTPKREGIERLGYRAAFQRLAGNRQEFDEAITEIRKFAESREAGSLERWYAAKALFLNDRASDALELLTRGHTAVLAKAEILATQMKYTSTLEFIDKAKGANPEEADALDVIRGRVLYFLGEKEQAKKIFAALAEKIRPGNDLPWFERLVESEFRLGLKEQAIEHCARALLASTSTFAQTRLLKKVMDGQEETAQAWWVVLRRKQASEEATVTMKGLRDLLAGKIKGKQLASLVEEAEVAGKDLPPDEWSRTLQAIGEVAVAAGEDDLAARSFTRATEDWPTQTPLVRWGDVLAGRKRWEKAAAVYASAWEKDRKQPLALYLRGNALVRASRKTEGEALMEQAHWLPLGDENLRVEFGRALLLHGHVEASRRERDLLLRTCPVGSYAAGEAHRLNSLDALREKKYLQSAELHEQALLRVLRQYVQFVETPAYVGLPHLVHRLRAAGLLAAGKLDEARKEIDRCVELLPGNPDVATQLVPELDRAGHKKDADALFERLRSFKTQLCKDYPNSAALRNSLAWMGATCRRDLENAQKFAERAVALEPSLPGYRDTLAEVLFQRGQKDRAITEMKKCLEQDPKRAYYRKQLKRFEAGDPKAPIPTE